jgi:hypothetical protein
MLAFSFRITEGIVRADFSEPGGGTNEQYCPNRVLPCWWKRS